MEDFLFSVNAVAPLFILIAAGYILRQFNFVSDIFLSEANKFVFKLLLPLMLFQNIRVTFHGDFTGFALIGSAVAGVLVVICVSLCIVPLFVKSKGQRGSMIQGIYRSNFLIYGLPLATGMYGEEARASISMLMGIMIPFYNVMAVIILSIYSETGKKTTSITSILKDIITNPLILGCIFGLLGGISQVNLPRFLETPLAQFSAMATPLALFVMGGEFKFSSLKNNLTKVIAASAARLIIVPGIMLFICIQLGFRGIDLAVLISIFATPTAMASYIMAKNMGNDGTLSAQIVVLSTTCSCVTIFFIIYFLRNWGYL